ncbi:uncharacterized protein LOC142338672 isoform X2 [Convolutriloba macropyga]|uniref:uncharacterized protein LOC142338672 isoform X2 n=1 Tax=Convolutriloba macropyga TaxID=536237 RepID=UPI003F522ACF
MPSDVRSGKAGEGGKEGEGGGGKEDEKKGKDESKKKKCCKKFGDAMKKPEAGMTKMFYKIGRCISHSPGVIVFYFVTATCLITITAFVLRGIELEELDELFRTKEARRRNNLLKEIFDNWRKYGKNGRAKETTPLMVAMYQIMTNFTGQLFEAVATILDMDEVCTYVEFVPTFSSNIFFRELKGFDSDKTICGRNEFRKLAGWLRDMSNYDMKDMKKYNNATARNQTIDAIKKGAPSLLGPLGAIIFGTAAAGLGGGPVDPYLDNQLKMLGKAGSAFEEVEKILQQTKGRAVVEFAAAASRRLTSTWMLQKSYDTLNMANRGDVKMFRVTVFSEALYDKEKWAAIVVQLKLLAVCAFFIVFIAILISLNLHNWPLSRGIMAFLGTIMALLAIMLGFSIGLLCGLKLTILALFIPFLVIAVGIDSSFVVVNSWLHVIEDEGREIYDVPTLMGKTLEGCFLSVSLSDFTSIVSFIVGVFSPFAAVNLCSAFLALNFLALWICELFFFCPCLAVKSKLLLERIAEAHPNSAHFGWCRRRNLGRKKEADKAADLFDLDNESEVYVFNYYEQKIGSFFALLTKNKCVRFMWVLVFLILIAIGIYGISTMRVYESVRDYLDEKSVIHEFYQVALENPILQFSPTSVVVSCPDNFLFDQNFIGRIYALQQRILGDREFFRMNRSKSFDCFLNYANTATSKSVRGLATVCNATDESEVIMDAHPNDKPEHLVFSCERKTAPEGDVPKEIIVVNGLEKVESEFSDIDMFFYDEPFGLMMTRLLLVPTLWMSVALSLVCSLVMLVIFVPEPLTIVMTLIATFITFIITMGLMSLAGLTYNSLTFMLALIAMGVSIDYMAHSGRAYFSLSAEYSDPEKARAETMTEVRKPTL